MPSEAYALILNLLETARHHSAHCGNVGFGKAGEECQVSLMQVKMAAQRLKSFANTAELPELDQLMQSDKWPC